MVKRWMKGLSESAKELKNTRAMVTCAMLLAVEIVLNLTVSIYVSSFLRISFGFLAIAACGYLYGPSPAMMIAALSDIVVFLLRPTGAFFPGFTLDAALIGLVYGLAFYKMEKVNLPRILVTQGIVALVIHIALNTLWLMMLQGKAYFAILPARALKNAIQYPVDVALLYALMYFLRGHFRRA